ncbi:bacterial sugar transferase [Clostridium sp. CAG:921]|nr:bacterial sugar transferase [Clostridium sp. CAG:921]
MILGKYEDLPENMKNDSVKKYYDILAKKKFSLAIKRIFDIIFSLLLLILLLPVLVLLAIAIKIDSKGPVFYRQERITKNGKSFRIFKFRTMVQNADKIGSLVTVGNDSRITRIGKVIRKIRLDELPQLINILKGEMSFVGTRPEVKKYVEKYTDEMMATLLMPAGVTSYASIMYKDEDEVISNLQKSGKTVDEIYIEDVLPEKMKYNLEYIRKFSFGYDIRLCFKTVIGVLK